MKFSVIELSTAPVCPSDWVVQEHSIGNELPECGPPCTIFTEQQKYVAAVVIGIFAASTLVSSLFTIITSILDSSRFPYPERAIVHLAVCYAALAVCYLIGVTLNILLVNPYQSFINLLGKTNKQFLYVFFTGNMGHRN